METSKLILNWNEFYFTDDNTQANWIHKIMLNWEAYNIREYQWGGWQPWANTLLYVPMKDDLTDHWPSQFSLTNNWVSLVSTEADIDVWYFDNSSNIKCSSVISFTDFHVWFRAKLQQASNQIFAWWNNWNMFLANQSGMWIWIGRNGVAWDSNANYTFNSNNWYYICYDKTWTSFTITINNSVVLSVSNNKSYSLNWFVIWSDNWENIYTYWYLSNLIMESVAWSAQEISDYYDQTKSLYGIS